MNKKILPYIECGPMFLAALAYPKSKRSREHFAGAILCLAAEASWTSEEVRLVCLMQDRTKVDRELKRGIRLIADRLAAAKMAFPEYHAHVSDHIGERRPAKVPSHSSAEMFASINFDLRRPDRPRDKRGRNLKSDGTDFNAGNIKSRIWKPSLPVLHMAIALDREIGTEKTSVGDVVFDPDRCLRLIKNSETHRPIVAEKFKIPPEEQITLTFTDAGHDNPDTGL